MAFLLQVKALGPVKFVNGFDIVDRMTNTWIDEYVNIYPDEVSDIVSVDGVHWLEVSEVYASHGYEVADLPERVYWRRYPSVQDYVAAQQQIIAELRETGRKIFLRSLLRRFNNVGHRLSEDEWRIWLDNEKEVNAYLGYLRQIW